MGTTTGAPWNLRVPTIGEQADGPGAIGDLADDVAAALSSLVPEGRTFGSWERTTDQTVAHNTVTSVIYNVAGTSNTPDLTMDGAGVVTIQRAGLYIVSHRFWFVPNQTGIRLGYLLLNGALVARYGAGASGNSGEGGGGITFPVVLSAGDQILTRVFQNSGAALALSSFNASNGLRIARIGD